MFVGEAHYGGVAGKQLWATYFDGKAGKATASSRTMHTRGKSPQPRYATVSVADSLNTHADAPFSSDRVKASSTLATRAPGRESLHTSMRSDGKQSDV